MQTEVWSMLHYAERCTDLGTMPCHYDKHVDFCVQNSIPMYSGLVKISASQDMGEVNESNEVRTESRDSDI